MVSFSYQILIDLESTIFIHLSVVFQLVDEKMGEMGGMQRGTYSES